MENFTRYLFSALWGVIGIYLIYAGKKVNKFCYFLSLLFFFMCGWYLANQLMPDIDLFQNTPGIIFRVVVGIFLVIGIVIYFTKVKGSGNKE